MLLFKDSSKFHTLRKGVSYISNLCFFYNSTDEVNHQQQSEFYGRKGKKLVKLRKEWSFRLKMAENFKWSIVTCWNEELVSMDLVLKCPSVMYSDGSRLGADICC